MFESLNKFFDSSATWFEAKPWTIQDAEAGKYALRFSKVLDCDNHLAFKAFDNEHLSNWFDDINKVFWVSPKVESKGAIRQVNLKTIKVREHFLIWQPGQRFTFYIQSFSLPLLESMMEDCQFESLDNGQCKVSWNVYYKPTAVTKLLMPVLKPMYEKMFSKGLDHLELYVKQLK